MKRKPWLLCAAILPAIAAYLILFLQAFSLPYEDDYHAILSFAVDYQQQTTWGKKLLVIASQQHNEYKLAFMHAIVAAELETTRHLNFLFLCILGDLSLLPLAWFLWKTYANVGLLGFLPMSLLFFSLTYWDTLNWAMAGLQNIPVIAFSLLAIYLLAADAQQNASPAPLALACLAAALAAFTSANGFLLAPVGLLMLLRHQTYARAFLWCISFIAPLAAYLFHFVPVAYPAAGYAYIARPFFFLAFLGCVVPIAWVAVLLGLGILSILFWAVRSRFDRVNPVACYFALWILVTAAVVAWVRGAVGLFITSRYSVYSVLLVIFCYAFLTHHLATRSATVRRAFYAVSLIVAMGVCLAADGNARQKFGERRRMVLAGMELYRADPAIHSPMIDPRIMRASPAEEAYERGMLTEAIEKGIVTLECNECRRVR